MNHYVKKLVKKLKQHGIKVLEVKQGSKHYRLTLEGSSTPLICSGTPRCEHISHLAAVTQAKKLLQLQSL